MDAFDIKCSCGVKQDKNGGKKTKIPDTCNKKGFFGSTGGFRPVEPESDQEVRT